VIKKSVPFQRCFPYGYTLIEIAIVLAIIAVITAASLPFFSAEFTEQRLRRPATALQEFAVKARAAAMESGRPTTIRFNEDGFALFTQWEEEDPDAHEAETPMETVPLERGLRLEWRRTEADAWLPVSGKEWIFYPSGICSPMGIRIAQGRASLELDFDILTSRVASEQFFIP